MLTYVICIFSPNNISCICISTGLLEMLTWIMFVYANCLLIIVTYSDTCT